MNSMQTCNSVNFYFIKKQGGITSLHGIHGLCIYVYIFYCSFFQIFYKVAFSDTLI